MDNVRTRFAPSPTGFMHVGNLRTALYAWLLARSQNGQFILRIEDTDSARYVENAVEVIYDTLDAAGLHHDEGPDVGGDYGPYVQSERKAIYRQYAQELVASGDAYFCFCEKVDHNPDANPGDEDSPAVGYDGRCRDLEPATVRQYLEEGRPYVIRQRIEKSGSTTFEDSVFGSITIENKVLDDQILIKRDGMPTYNFANVVDDHLMHITHVVRGSEYLSSTPKYNLLYQAFGWPIPTYVHLPLIMGRNPDGTVAKLSKRHGSVSFENLVADGYLPEAIINYIALLGWSPKNDMEIFSRDELAALFTLSGLNKAPAIFDYAKLDWMNAEYIKALTPEDFTERARCFAKVDGTPLESHWPELAVLLQPRTERFSDIPEKIVFFKALPGYGPELFFNKKCKSTPESAEKIITELLPEFRNVPEWSVTTLTAIITDYATRHELKLGLPMWAVRIAVSGQAVTPGGPAEIMHILGRDESLRRLEIALTRVR